MISPERLDIVQTQWLRLTEPFADATEALRVFDDLIARHSEPHRHYHNLEHVGEVLKTAARLASHADDPVAVAFAAWFHDAVYDPRQSNNEEESMVFFTSAAAVFNMPSPQRDKIASLILATKTHTATTANERVLLDADLAILAAAEARYDRYASEIRKEYARVSDGEYRLGRKAVLERFLARDRIYHTPPMTVEGEAAARRNLRREADNLA